MLAFLDPLRDLSLVGIAVRFLVACLFGGIVGLERGFKHRAAGLRTHMMVCIGAASTMIVGDYVTSASGFGDALRMGAQVVSGVGFLGMGTIIVTRHKQISGLTTAATIWTASCMGLVIGAGFYEAATLMVLFMLFVLLVLARFDGKYVKHYEQHSLLVEMERESSFAPLLQQIKAQGFKVQEIRDLPFSEKQILSLRIDIISEEQENSAKLDVKALTSYDKVKHIEEL